jgi:hypothetical protein
VVSAVVESVSCLVDSVSVLGDKVSVLGFRVSLLVVISTVLELAIWTVMFTGV